MKSAGADAVALDGASANTAGDTDSLWNLSVDGEQLESQLAEQALSLNPDTFWGCLSH